MEIEAILKLGLFLIQWLGIKNLVAGQASVLDEGPDQVLFVHASSAEMAHLQLLQIS